jgi:hypothetical protein
MCGRITSKLAWEEIVAQYRLTLGQPAANTRARHNVWALHSQAQTLAPSTQRRSPRFQTA